MKVLIAIFLLSSFKSFGQMDELTYLQTDEGIMISEAFQEGGHQGAFFQEASASQCGQGLSYDRGIAKRAAKRAISCRRKSVTGCYLAAYVWVCTACCK